MSKKNPLKPLKHYERETAIEVKEEISQELTPREKRLLKAQAKQVAEVKEVDHREEFRQYFVQLKTKLKLDPSLEKILWLHLKAINCDKAEDFEKGIKHFGLKF